MEKGEWKKTLKPGGEIPAETSHFPTKRGSLGNRPDGVRI